jgi:hypothetical protein
MSTHTINNRKTMFNLLGLSMSWKNSTIASQRHRSCVWWFISLRFKLQMVSKAARDETSEFACHSGNGQVENENRQSVAAFFSFDMFLEKAQKGRYFRRICVV